LHEEHLHSSALIPLHPKAYFIKLGYASILLPRSSQIGVYFSRLASIGVG
jgi:hypothetical protein